MMQLVRLDRFIDQLFHSGAAFNTVIVNKFQHGYGTCSNAVCNLASNEAGRTVQRFERILSQSVICAALFNSHGLGLYGTVSPWQGLLLTIVIFSLQIALSAWWLGRFRYGPVEWVWRSLTYGRLQPMRRAAQGAV